MTLYKELLPLFIKSPKIISSKFTEAKDGVIIDFKNKYDLKDFFESQFKWMQENDISSKVIGKTLYLWRRKWKS